jgi:formylglycine-generating enzyme required for sulfatase activity
MRAPFVFLALLPAICLFSQNTTRQNAKDGLTYVWIPHGTFQMGCSPGDSECYDSEKPTHQVTITRGFWLGQTEVTQDAYLRVIGENPSYYKGSGKLPVEQVTWDDARAYCQAVNGRLPTEAEWEYAARAGTTGILYGKLDRIAWYVGNSGGKGHINWYDFAKTHEVGLKQANAFGLYDMLGNVSEWVADWQGGYSAGAQTDPAGPASGTSRVLRGGSFNAGANYARASDRGWNVPEYRVMLIGIRCAAD